MSDVELNPIGTVGACWRYPVKSFQGLAVDALDVGPTGIVGDRAFGLVDVATGRLLSAKRTAVLLSGTTDGTSISLPDGTTVGLDDPAAEATVSAWLGKQVRVVRAGDAGPVAYEMTFDPPNEDAEVFDIPVPEGTLLDLSAVHLIASATLAHCAAQRPDLDWDVRRFRPNLVVDVDVEPFGEQAWIGREVTIGGAVLSVPLAMLRCAMTLRPQPGGIAKEPGIFQALTELNGEFPNHLGLACNVVRPGPIRVGDAVSVA